MRGRGDPWLTVALSYLLRSRSGRRSALGSTSVLGADKRRRDNEALRWCEQRYGGGNGSGYLHC